MWNAQRSLSWTFRISAAWRMAWNYYDASKKKKNLLLIFALSNCCANQTARCPMVCLFSCTFSMSKFVFFMSLFIVSPDNSAFTDKENVVLSGFKKNVTKDRYSQISLKTRFFPFPVIIYTGLSQGGFWKCCSTPCWSGPVPNFTLYEFHISFTFSFFSVVK